MTSPRSGEPTSESEVPEAMPGIPDATLSSPTFFETSSGPVSSTSASEFGDILSAPIEPDEIGRLGNYRVLSVLGRGGMGVVFRARDPQLNRVVALKVMRPEIARNPQAAERFLREARAAATVKHDHIITIFQVGKEGGVPFIALEFLKGEGLDERMNRERILPHMEVSRIGHQTALGLAAAHAEGLIHRDIKPANIWLEAPSGRVKILDFGLARTGQDNVNLTGSGTVVGTPAYMSPEQANGDPVDHRSDLFSLGVMLYRMATGEAPFRGEATLAILTQLAIHVPPPPRSLNSAVPHALSDVIMRLLAKQPDQRLQTADEVARLLAPPPSATVQIIVEALPLEENHSAFEFDEPATEVMPLPKAVERIEPAKPKKIRSRKLPVLVPLLCLLGVLLIGTGSWKLWQKLRTKETQAVVEGGKEGPAPKPKIDSSGRPVDPQAPVFVPPFDDGPSPLDNLDPAKIPASERFAWQPKELVAVIGTHKMRHWGVISRVVYSPKGDLVASLGTDGVRVWDAKTMAEKIFIRHRTLKYPTHAVDFLLDGRLMMCDGGGALLHDLSGPTPKNVGLITGYSSLQSVTPDGKQVVVRDHNAAAHRYEAWDIAGDQPKKIKTVPDVPAGNTYFVVGNDRLLDIPIPEAGKPLVARLIDLAEDGKVLEQLELDTPEYAVSSDGKWFARSTPEGKKTVRVYDISGGKFAEKGTFEDESLATHRAHHLAFIPGTDKLCFQAGDKSYWVRDLAAGKTTVLNQDRPVTMQHAFAPGGKRITAWQDNRLTSFDVTDAGKVTLAVSSGPTQRVFPAANANRVMSWEEAPNSPNRWDLDGPVPKPREIYQAMSGYGLAALPDGRVVGRNDAGYISIFDPRKGDGAKPVEVAPGYFDLHLASASRSGRWLSAAILVQTSRSPKLFDLAGAKPVLVADLKEYPTNGQAVQRLEFSPGEQFVAAVGGSVEGVWGTWVWDLRGPKPKHIGTLPLGSSAMFAIDRPTLVVGYLDGKVKLLDYSTGELKDAVEMQPFTRRVTGAILLPGGKTVMVGDDSGLIKFITVATGEVEKEWKWPGAAGLWLANDGRHVFTQNANGTGYVLRLAEAPKVVASPLDALKREAIPKAELVPELPADAVAVIGSHAGKHWGGVNAIACTPDGKLLATGGLDGFVRLFDPASKKELAVVQAHASPITWLVLTSDGRTLVSCDGSGSKVWAIVEGRLNHRFEIFGPASFSTLSPDGKRLILVASDDGIRVFDISGGEPRVIVKSAEGHKGFLWTPVYVRGDRQFATTGADKTVRIWDAATGQAVHSFGPYEHPMGLHRVGDGHTLLGIDKAGTVRRWDLRDLELKESSLRFKATENYESAFVAADGSRFALGRNSSVQVWNLPDPGERPIAEFSASSSRVALTADGKTLFASQLGSIGVADMAAPTPTWNPLLPDWEWYYRFKIAPSGAVLGQRMNGSLQYENGCWHPLLGSAFGRPKPEPRIFFPDSESVWFPRGPKSTAMYATLNNTELVQYDLSQPPNSPPVRKVNAKGQIWGLHGSADGSTFAVLTSTGEERTVIVLRPEGEGFKEVARVEKKPQIIGRVRLSADGRVLYFGDSATLHGGNLQKWDLTGPQPKEVKLPAGFDGIANWDLSADGRRLGTMTGKGFTVWDITGPEPRSLVKVDGLVIGGYWTSAVSPDGRQVVIGGQNSTTRYWYGLYDTTTGTKRREWTFPHTLNSIQFAPDGRHLVTANSNGTGYVIRLQSGPKP